MSASHPLRYLFAKPTIPSRCLRRSFHPSKSLNARPKPKFPSIKASKLDLVNKANFPRYSEADKEALAEKYSPAQIASIEAGEAAIDENDLANQAAFREDSMGLDYIDDLSKIHPVVDKPIRAPKSNYDPNLRLKGEAEFADELTNWVRNQTEDVSEQDWEDFDDNLRLTVGKEEAERNPPSSLAPEIPKLRGFRTSSVDKDEKDEISPALRRLMLQTGYTASEIRRFRVKLLVTRRVVNLTKLGKIQSLYHLSVAGNGKGMLGLGESKSAQLEGAKDQSFLNAIRSMRPIPRYEGRTIFGDVRGKVGGTELELMTRPPGRSPSVFNPMVLLTEQSQVSASDVNPLYMKCASVQVSPISPRV